MSVQSLQVQSLLAENEKKRFLLNLMRIRKEKNYLEIYETKKLCGSFN